MRQVSPRRNIDFHNPATLWMNVVTGTVSARLDLVLGHYEHRFLLWLDNEFGVRFRSLTSTQRPAQPSDRRLGPDRD